MEATPSSIAPTARRSLDEVLGTAENANRDRARARLFCETLHRGGLSEDGNHRDAGGFLGRVLVALYTIFRMDADAHGTSIDRSRRKVNFSGNE